VGLLSRLSASSIAAASLAVAALAAQGTPAAAPTVDVQILAFNDFHGALEPPAGANGRIANTIAGGVEYFAAHLARLKAASPHTVIVSAGDNIGGTPLLSSLFHDEASVEALNIAGLDLSAVGNHDLDEGWWELYRMVKGGCHPADGCQDGTPYEGAKFTYLSANITLDPRKADPARVAAAGLTGTQPRPLFMPYAIREFEGVRVGFIGLTLQGAPRIITPVATMGLTFSPEPEAANEAAKRLRGLGVDAIVVLIHQGGLPRGNNPDACDGISRDIVDLVNRMSDDIDVVVSGHSHTAYNCTIGTKLVTSASSNGRVITDIDLKLQRGTGKLVSKAAHNIVVSRDVDANAAETALVSRYRPLAVKVGGRVVGAITATLPRAFNDSGESALGDVIADAMLEMAKNTPGAGGDVAFMNPGGIRADLAAAGGASSTAVTYAQLFEITPFGNIVIAKTLTGDALVQMLEEQFGRAVTRVLQVSNGFTYSYDPSRPPGQRIDRASIRISGQPLVPTKGYRVVTVDFIWNGGDDFATVKSGTDAVTVGTDVDVLAAYVTKHSPVSPGPQNRIHKQR
jgi:5'-nucleotidase